MKSSRILSEWVFVVATAIALGCKQDVPPSGPKWRAASPLLDVAAPRTGRIWTNDDEQARIAREEVPGYAGFFTDRDGNVTMALRDTSNTQPADAALSRHLQEWYGEGAKHLRINKHKKAEYDFAQLKQWHDSLMFRLVPRGLTYSDVNEVENQVWLGIAPGKDIQSVHAAIKDLQIPENAVHIEVSRYDDQPMLCAEGDPDCTPSDPPPPPPSYDVGGVAVLPSTLDSHQIQLVGGIQIWFIAFDGSKKGCSMFGVGTVFGVRGFLTAAHCSYNTKANASHYQDTDYHQGMDDNDAAFAQSNISPAHYPFGQLSGCPKTDGCRLSDALFATFTGFPQWSHYIATTDHFYSGTQSWLNLQGLHAVTSNQTYAAVEPGKMPAPSGSYLEKVGAYTGWTGGYITETCYNSFRSNGDALMCQEVAQGVFTTPKFVDNGDSGGPVFSYFPYFNGHNGPTSNAVQLEGIISAQKAGDARYLVFSPMINIRNEFSSFPNGTDVCFWEGC